MKKLFLLLLISSASYFASGQTNNLKGLSVVQPTTEQKLIGKTYALVVGISKYKSNEIPSLQFADKDAIAFRNYLVASGVDSTNITLLTNENAKYSEILLDLDDICTKKVKAGDKFYFYFSGHGDVESHVITNDGYLLPYDAPKVVYAISSIPVRLLQSYISTLSSKGVQPIVITDACHSGNLAGGIEGMANIQNVLKDAWKDEIKILSCQPGELSLEGKQWGNGRGLFSYELTKGMAGDADKNNDGKVTMLELNLYMMNKVPEESYPIPQTPMFSGNMQQSISIVNKSYLDKLNTNSSSQTYGMIDMKGFDEGLLKNLNDSIGKNYRLFKTCLDSGILFNQTQLPSAYLYYNRIPENDSTQTIISLMKRNYCSAVINHLNIVSNSAIENTRVLYTPQEVLNYINEATTLRRLLGDEKLKTIGFLAKVILTQCDIVSITPAPIPQKLETEVLKKLDTCLLIEPSALVYAERGLAYFKANKFKQCIEEENKAIQFSPKFLMQYLIIAEAYSALEKHDSCINVYSHILKVDSSYNPAIMGIALEYFKMGVKDSSNYYLEKIANQKSDFKREENILILCNTYYQIGEFKKSIFYLMEALKNKPNDVSLNFTLSSCYAMLNDKKNAIIHLEKCINLGVGFNDLSQAGKALNGLQSTIDYKSLMIKYFPAEYYYSNHEYAKAIIYLFKSIDKANNNDRSGIYYNIASCYSLNQNKINAIKYLELSFQNGYDDFDNLQTDTDLENIRSYPEFKKLVVKYFPEKK